MGDKLKDKVALITGGGKGIGRVTALAFAEEGADIIVAARTQSDIEKVADEVRSLGRRAMPVRTDVTEETQVINMVERTLKEFGKIDILVNSAGIGIFAPVVDFKTEDWDLLMAVNLKGTFLCTREVLRHMIRRQEGTIINISSQAGKAGGTHCGGYAASKFGVIGFTQSLAEEMRSYKRIKVAAVCPGGVDTDFNQEGQPIPPNRAGFMKPEAVAHVILMIAAQHPSSKIAEILIRSLN